MNYFLDTEFMEDCKTVDLLSLALVYEDGRELYLENESADFSKANDWVKANVIPQLWRASRRKLGNAFIRDGGKGGLFKRDELASEVQRFIGADEKPRFWGYYADYDWVAFCQLFGKMIDLPKGFPMYCLDLKQLAFHLGNPELPKQTTEHHALLDARWNKEAFEFLKQRSPYGLHLQA